MYRVIYAVLLRRVPPEAAHRAAFWLIRAAAEVPGLAWALRRALGPRDPSLRVRALGLDFPGPLGLAAGFDKDGEGVIGLAALGFSFIEVGTVTALPQPGNPRPRMFRFTDERALVNRMGFNNHGAPRRCPPGCGRCAPGPGSSRSSASTSARRRSSPRKRPSPTTSPAPASSPTWPTTWSSTSARPTRPACATCRRPTSCGRSSAGSARPSTRPPPAAGFPCW